MGKWIPAFFLFFTAITAHAQDNAPMEDTPESPSSPLLTLGDEYHNSIKLLQNRFRIDHNVEEITMIFFRRRGSAPVVLVRPDGSKLFQGRVDTRRVDWYDDETFDMISIKNPVPGPWQAVGQILPNSRVMVLSDLKLHAQSLPSMMFSGEIIKSTASLTNGGEPIANNEFRDVVELTIDFVSSNNPNYDNFGSSDVEIARFEDDGRGMDERPTDGVFTGQFNLGIAPGEWQPIFRVTTPMLTREQVDPPIVLYPNPVIVDVVHDGGGEGYHKLIVDVNRDQVDIESLLIDGKVRYPNSEMQNFSLTEGGDAAREHLVPAYDDGIFRVKMTAYGTTVDGRDFILDVPEFTFLAESPEPDIIDPLAPLQETVEDDEMVMENEQLDMPEMPKDEEMDSETLVLLLVTVNGAIVVVGGLIVAIVMIRRKRTNKGASTKVATEQDLTLTEQPKGLAKLFGMFKKNKA